MTPGRKGREDGQWAKRVGRELGAQRAGELGARVPKVGVGQRGRFPAFNQSAQAWPRGPCQAVWKIQRNPVKTVARPCPCLSLIQGKSNPCTTDFPLRAHTVFLTSYCWTQLITHSGQFTEACSSSKASGPLSQPYTHPKCPFPRHLPGALTSCGQTSERPSLRTPHNAAVVLRARPLPLPGTHYHPYPGLLLVVVPVII